MRDPSPKIVTSYEAQEALVRKFFERRNVQLVEGVRHERHVIAARMAAEGTLNSGGFVTTVTSAYVAGFEAFARGLTKDIFDLVHRSGMAMGNATTSWIKSQLEPMFEVAAKNMVSEAAQGRVLPDELRQNVDRAMDKSLAEMKRDLGIELDLALLAPADPAVVIDAALLDALVPLQNRRGLEQAFAARTKDEPLCVVIFDVDHFKDVNDNQGGHAIGDEALLSIAEAAASCTRGNAGAYGASNRLKRSTRVGMTLAAPDELWSGSPHPRRSVPCAHAEPALGGGSRPGRAGSIGPQVARQRSQNRRRRDGRWTR